VGAIAAAIAERQRVSVMCRKFRESAMCIRRAAVLQVRDIRFRPRKVTDRFSVCSKMVKEATAGNKFRVSLALPVRFDPPSSILI
jgi:hypothetical protein